MSWLLEPRTRDEAPSRRVAGDDAAQATVWTLAVLVVVMVSLSVLVRWSAATVASARLDATADLVALAAVTGGAGDAEDVARRNGARLDAFETSGMAVTVQVSRSGLTAQATAEAVHSDR